MDFWRLQGTSGALRDFQGKFEDFRGLQRRSGMSGDFRGLEGLLETSGYFRGFLGSSFAIMGLQGNSDVIGFQGTSGDLTELQRISRDFRGLEGTSGDFWRP